MKVNLNVTRNLKEIVIASTNLNKLNEFNAVLTPKGFKLLSRLDLNFEDEIEETGSTFEQNALIKAKVVGRGQGKSKKRAEQNAAKNALEALNR